MGERYGKCPTCNGEGEVPTGNEAEPMQDCWRCNGEGFDGSADAISVQRD